MHWIEIINQIGTGKLLIIIMMIALTNFIDTTAYSARLTGVRTKKLALSNSLYSMLTFGSRTTTVLYIAPIGGIIDRAVKQQFDPLFILQLVLIGAIIGTALAILLMPTTTKFYELGIERMEQDGTAMKVFKSLLLTKQGIQQVFRCWNTPKLRMFKGVSLLGVPKSMIVLNAILYSFFTVGSIAAFYGAWLQPEYMVRATSLSSAINAIGAFMLLFLVDPRSAIMIDMGINRTLHLNVVKSSMVYLAISRLIGTILSILVLYPASLLVVFMAKFF